ncbi:hypothetical protein GHT06_014712 [Daphnia sinensis]|uniref:Uncharacterized protein n=1 Tax=Daphnia sinensis TaxID=1820382 RepID=A0AAD5L9R5_9CRUS|nr:hypothetical protein GHT06_014712 [Daphnia sinensis]
MMDSGCMVLYCTLGDVTVYSNTDCCAHEGSDNYWRAFTGLVTTHSGSPKKYWDSGVVSSSCGAPCGWFGVRFFGVFAGGFPGQEDGKVIMALFV